MGGSASQYGVVCKYEHSEGLKADLWIQISAGKGVYFGEKAKIAWLYVSVIILPSMHCIRVLKKSV